MLDEFASEKVGAVSAAPQLGLNQISASVVLVDEVTALDHPGDEDVRLGVAEVKSAIQATSKFPAVVA